MSKKQSIKKNYLYSVSYEIISIVFPLITAPYVTRVLGAKVLGVYSTTQALAYYFVIFAMLGVNRYGNRAIARVRDDREEMSRTFWEIFAFQLFTGTVSVICYVCYCLRYTGEYQLIYTLQIFYVLSGMLNLDWCCYGLERFQLTTLRSLMIRLFSLAGILLFVKDTGDLWIYTLILSLSSILSCLCVMPFLRKEIDFVRPTLRGILRHIKPNLLLFWPVIAISFYSTMDKLMLAYHAESEEVGYYTYAERIVVIPVSFIGALDSVLMPRMSNLFATHQEEKTTKIMDIVMLFAMWLSCAMAFGLAGCAKVFVPWFYGKDFTRCGLFVMLLSITIIIKSWAEALRTQYIIPKGKDMMYVISLTSGAAINLAVNLCLIPVLYGIGAIIGTIAAELSVCVIQFAACSKELRMGHYLRDGMVFCGIGAVMFAAVYALCGLRYSAPITLLIQILTGIMIYVLLSGFYMIKIIKNPVLINEGLKTLHIPFQISEDCKNVEKRPQ